MIKNKWIKADKKILRCEKKVKIPQENLADVPCINLNKERDFNKIPKGKGCYWIWTNEPILHSLRKGEKFPKKIARGEIIYNGVTEGDVRNRIKHHLLNENPKENRSGVSIDIFLRRGTKSHRKQAMAKSKKVPYLSKEKIISKKLLLKLNLSKKEKEFVKRNQPPFYFRNGINIFEPKHKKYKYKVYFITNLKSVSYAELIERRWRKSYGTPKLCSYTSGR